MKIVKVRDADRDLHPITVRDDAIHVPASGDGWSNDQNGPLLMCVFLGTVEKFKLQRSRDDASAMNVLFGEEGNEKRVASFDTSNGELEMKSTQDGKGVAIFRKRRDKGCGCSGSTHDSVRVSDTSAPLSARLRAAQSDLDAFWAAQAAKEQE
jgi:hypothetical protein